MFGELQTSNLSSITSRNNSRAYLMALIAGGRESHSVYDRTELRGSFRSAGRSADARRQQREDVRRNNLLTGLGALPVVQQCLEPQGLRRGQLHCRGES